MIEIDKSKNVRTAKKLFYGHWIDAEPFYLRVGDFFKIFDPDGSQVEGIWLATGNAELESNGIIAINCELWSK